MKTRRFRRSGRGSTAQPLEPRSNPYESWAEKLSEMTDDELMAAGTWSDLDGLRPVSEDRDWVAEMDERGLL
jgi:hypothetical protein